MHQISLFKSGFLCHNSQNNHIGEMLFTSSECLKLYFIGVCNNWGYIIRDSQPTLVSIIIYIHFGSA